MKKYCLPPAARAVMKGNDMNNRIVALVGMCGAGKSVVCEMFESAGWQKVYFGGVTMEELEKAGLEKNEKNEREVRERLRREYGSAAFAILLKPKIKQKLEKSNVVLDGLYSWSEYKCLKDEFGDTLEVLAVVTDRAIRYSRLAKRAGRPLTADEASSRDWAEIEKLEKGGPISIADHYVLNNGDIEVVRTEVEKIIGK